MEKIKKYPKLWALLSEVGPSTALAELSLYKFSKDGIKVVSDGSVDGLKSSDVSDGIEKCFSGHDYIEESFNDFNRATKEDPDIIKEIYSIKNEKEQKVWGKNYAYLKDVEMSFLKERDSFKIPVFNYLIIFFCTGEKDQEKVLNEYSGFKFNYDKSDKNERRIAFYGFALDFSKKSAEGESHERDHKWDNPVYF